MCFLSTTPFPRSTALLPLHVASSMVGTRPPPGFPALTSRPLFSASSEGLLSSVREVKGVTAMVDESGVANDRTPILIVVPDLTSDSSAVYIKLLVFKMAKGEWNVVVSSHHGLGGISVTYNTFYNAGWTENLRKIVEYLHQHYPKAPLFLVGTSIGANILVKYLAEESDCTHQWGHCYLLSLGSSGLSTGGSFRNFMTKFSQ